jgi:hypothetical protein
MYSRTFRKADRIRRFSITNTPASGWVVAEEADSRTVSRVCYTDWHRVERALVRFSKAAEWLEAEGWIEAREGRALYSTKR